MANHSPAKPKYYAYIRSPEWRAKAEAAKRRAGYRCQALQRSACTGT